jgi:hypothetical protein
MVFSPNKGAHARTRYDKLDVMSIAFSYVAVTAVSSRCVNTFQLGKLVDVIDADVWTRDVSFLAWLARFFKKA